MRYRIEELSSYCGTLEFWEEDGVYYWAIEEGDLFEFEIPQYLFEALLTYYKTIYG